MTAHDAASGLSDLVTATVAFHKRELPEYVTLWNDALQIVQDAVQPMNGQESIEHVYATRLALILTATQTLFCAETLALQGFYLQAANLLRSPVEYLAAVEYLRYRPEEFVRFIDEGKTTPSFNELKQGIGSGARKQFDKKTALAFEEQIQTFMNDLHPFSHVDKKALLAMSLRDNGKGGMSILVGPDQDAGLFRSIAFRAIFLLDCFIQSAMDIRRALGHPDFLEGNDLNRRLKKLGQQIVSKSTSDAMAARD